MVQVSSLHLYSLLAHAAFIAVQKFFTSIIFSPPFSVSLTITFRAILSLLYLHKNPNISLFS